MPLALLFAPSSLAASEPVRVSHRDRLYDVAVQGELALVVGYPGLVLRSHDRGRTFSRVSVPTHDALFSVALGPGPFAVAAGRAGLLLWSEDQGKTWLRRPPPAGSTEPLFDVAITAPGHVVAVGELGTILVSKDRGKSFRRAAIDFALTPDNPGGDDADPEPEDDNAAVLEEARVTAVAFWDAQHGIAVGEFGVILRSRDAGESWTRAPSGTDQLLFGVATLGSLQAIAVGAEGTVLETSDGGERWSARAPPVAEHLFGVTSNGDRTLIVGADGTALVRSGAARELERTVTGVHTFLSAASFVDADHALLVGGRGHVLRTDDGGRTFVRVLGE